LKALAQRESETWTEVSALIEHTSLAPSADAGQAVCGGSQTAGQAARPG
jgi:hypothetical protein